MKNLNIIITEFINIAQSTKNLSSKTITAYKSDLNDFAKYVGHKSIEEEIILNYIQTLSQERGVSETSR